MYDNKNMKKTTVCLANDSFPPTIDGVANVVANYARIINKLSKAVVATPYDPDSDDSQYDFSIYRYPSINTRELIGYRTGIPFSLKVFNEIQNENIDIIHTHCPMTSCYLSRALRDITNKPIVLTWHTKYDIDINNAIASKLLRKEAIDAIIANVNACDEVWTVSKGAGENLKSLGYQGDYIVMENGVDLPKEKIKKDKALKLLKDYDLKTDKPILLFVGRMMWYKNIRLILDGLRGLEDDGIDYQMLFIGDGADKSEIMEYANSLKLNNVCFLSAIKEREMLRAFYSIANLFVFPSTFDTNGLVVREAAACGLPSVLVKDSCAAEGAIDNHNAYLISEDYRSLHQKLKEILTSADQLNNVGINAQNELYISWEEACHKAYERYQIVIDNYNRSGIIHNDKLSVEIFELLSQGFNRYQEVKDKRDDLLEKINDQYDALKHLLADKDLVIHDKNISILKRIHLLIEEIRKID